MVHISVGAEDLAACIRNVHPLALPTSEGGTWFELGFGRGFQLLSQLNLFNAPRTGGRSNVSFKINKNHQLLRQLVTWVQNREIHPLSAISIFAFDTQY